jgi:hypothetical protein
MVAKRNDGGGGGSKKAFVPTGSKMPQRTPPPPVAGSVSRKLIPTQYSVPQHSTPPKSLKGSPQARGARAFAGGPFKKTVTLDASQIDDRRGKFLLGLVEVNRPRRTPNPVATTRKRKYPYLDVGGKTGGIYNMPVKPDPTPSPTPTPNPTPGPSLPTWDFGHDYKTSKRKLTRKR